MRKLTADERRDLLYMLDHGIGRSPRRANMILYVADGWQREKIAEALFGDASEIDEAVTLFEEGGLKALRR